MKLSLFWNTNRDLQQNNNVGKMNSYVKLNIDSDDILKANRLSLPSSKILSRQTLHILVIQFF